MIILRFLAHFFLIFSLFTYFQNENEAEIVKSFFEDVFVHGKSSEYLYKDYAFKNPENTKSTDEKVEIFSQHILYLKSQKEHLSRKDINFMVENYNNSSSANLLLFDKRATKNIFVVYVENKVESYVLMNDNKIESFNYVRKGSEGPAYFINNF